MTNTFPAFSVTLFIFSFVGAARADSLVLRSGDTVECEFVKYADDRFHVLVEGKPASYAARDVKSLIASRSPDADSDGQRSPAHDRLHRLLSTETVPKRFGFHESTLSAVTAWLEDRYDIPVYIDRKAMAEAGVEDLVDSPVFSCDVQGISVGDALALILRPHDLAYTLRNGTVFITTKAELGETSPKKGASPAKKNRR